MNSTKIIIDGTVRAHITETAKNGREMKAVAVITSGGSRDDVFKLRLREGQSVAEFPPGTHVRCEAYVNGREWRNPQTGKTAYFTDLNLAAISAATPAAKEQPQAEEELPLADDIPF